MKLSKYSVHKRLGWNKNRLVTNNGFPNQIKIIYLLTNVSNHLWNNDYSTPHDRPSFKTLAKIQPWSIYVTPHCQLSIPNVSNLHLVVQFPKSRAIVAATIHVLSTVAFQNPETPLLLCQRFFEATQIRKCSLQNRQMLMDITLNCPNKTNCLSVHVFVTMLYEGTFENLQMRQRN